jgi:enolase
MKIQSITGREIIDSRGNPTVEADVIVSGGIKATAAVPSGASTGTHEAHELRDQDPSRFKGLGVTKAVKNINTIIQENLIGLDADNQQLIDETLIKLDGTDNKEKLGANAMLAVSMASTKAAALAQEKPLYTWIAQLFGNPAVNFTLPLPMINVLNGGKHAFGASDMQEYMIMPVGAPSITEAIHWGAEVFHALGSLIKKAGHQTLVGDEGGYAPPLHSNQKPLEMLVDAIQAAGFTPGEHIAIAMDPAASEFYENKQYILKADDKVMSSAQLIDLYGQWIQKFPIVSIEDGLAEDDWEGFTLMTQKLGDNIQIVGDDLFVTNPTRLKQGIDQKAANAILIKLNQIGTVWETITTIKMAKEAGFNAIVSHRSGETEDTFIADFVVGAGTGQIKTGSMCRSERVAKYNRLIRIEEELGAMGSLAPLHQK